MPFFLRIFGAKFLIACFFALCMPAAYANLYRINLNYDDDATEAGSLTGFIIINTAALDEVQTINGNDVVVANNTNTATVFDIPSWITSASLTISGAVENNGTYTNFDSMVWATTGSDFDPDANFLNQMATFGLGDQSITRVFSLPPNSAGQRFDQGASPLEVELSSSTTIATPGPLPILGLVPLAFYYRKLKKKTFKL